MIRPATTIARLASKLFLAAVLLAWLNPLPAQHNTGATSTPFNHAPAGEGAAAGSGEVRLVVTGNTGGVSSWRNEIKGLFELKRKMKGSDASGETVLKEGYDTNFFRCGSRILFRDPPWSVNDFRKFLASGPRLDKVVCKEQWMLQSSSEITFELDFPKCGVFTITALDKLAEAEGLIPRSALAAVKSRGTGEVLKPVVEQKELGGLKWVTGRLRRAVGGGGYEAFLLEIPDPIDGSFSEAPLDTDPLAWENRFAERSRVRLGDVWHRVFTVARPFNDGSRRSKLLKELSGGGALHIDAGNMVEEADPSKGVDDAALFRKISWDEASRLRLAALAPGKKELAAGLSALAKEADGARVPLISANLLKDGQPVFKRYILLCAGERRVAAIGVTDPQIGKLLHPDKLEGATIAEPLDAVTEAVEELYREAATERIDLVVIVGNLSGRSRQALLSEQRGTDLIFLTEDDIQQEAGWPVRIEAPASGDDGEEEPAKRGRHRIPLYTRYLSRHGPDLATVTYAGSAGFSDIRGVLMQTSAVRESMPRDEQVAARVAEARQRQFDKGGEILLPDLDPVIKSSQEAVDRVLKDPAYRHLTQKEKESKEFQAVLTSELWSQMAASVMRGSFDADLAILSQMELQYGVAGPIPKLFCEQNIPSSIVLVRVDLPGTIVRSLMVSRLGRDGLQMSGVMESPFRIGGRPLMDEEWYRCVMTEDLWTDPAMGALLGSQKLSRDSAAKRFAKKVPGIGPYLPAKDGQVLTLRKLVMDNLEEWKKRDPQFSEASLAYLAGLMGSGGSRKQPRFYVDFKEISVGFQSWIEADEEARYYMDWPENTRANSEQLVRQNYFADATISYDTEKFLWTFRTKLIYDRDNYRDRDVENMDLLRLSTGLAFPEFGKELPWGLRLAPAFELCLDTELTRDEDENGDPLHRQFLLRGGAALVVSGWGSTELAKLSFFKQWDRSQEKYISGIEFDIDHKMALGPLKWSNIVESRYYFKSSADTSKDIWYYAKWRTSLEIPVMRNLSFCTYADFLVYKGKVAPSNKTGINTIIGIGVSYSRIRWKPGREPLFH